MIVTLYDPATGQVRCSTTVQLPLGTSDEDATPQDWATAVADLEAAVGMPCVIGAADDGQYVVDGQLVAMGERPSADHAWDWSVHAWRDPRTIEEIRERRWADIKRHRDLLEASGFPYRGKVLDSDTRSVQRINTAVQAAQAALAVGAPFSIVWTCADNTTLALDGPGMLGAPVALALYADQLHQIAKTLRAQIDAAETAEAVAAVEWPITNT